MMEFAVMIMAVSVAVLVVYLVMTLKKVQTSLDTANQTLGEARDAIHSWKGDVQGLVVSVKDLTNQVNRQIDAVDPLMASVRDMGEAIHEVTSSAKEVTESWMGKLRSQAQKATVATKGSWMDWVEAGVKAYHVVRSATKVLRTSPQAVEALQQEVRNDIHEIERDVIKKDRLSGHGGAVTLG